MDVIADALLGLATCESGIKSLSDILSSLHAINALHRLKEKADVVEVLLAIASFAPFFAPTPLPLLASAPPPSTNVGVDESLIEARLERLERRAEMLRLDRLAVLEERQDETTIFPQLAVLGHPSTVEDGRDDDPAPSPQPVLNQLAPAPLPHRHLTHPERQSELNPFASKEKPLYSFLIHFPVFSAVGAKLSSVDREELFSLPAMAKWGFGNSMTTLAYPCLHLTNEGTACIVVDDDLGRLEEIRKDLEEAQRELWDKNVTGMLDRTFFLVGTWKEEHVSLAFSLSWCRYLQQGPGDFEKWTAPGNLWKDILEVYPILSHYQELAHGHEEGKPLLGAGLFYRSQLYANDHNFTIHYLALIVPLLWSPRALMFANDFVAQSYPLSLVLNRGTRCEVDVGVVKMGPPALKDERHWDGSVLRNDKWLRGPDDWLGRLGNKLLS